MQAIAEQFRAEQEPGGATHFGEWRETYEEAKQDGIAQLTGDDARWKSFTVKKVFTTKELGASQG